MNLLKNFVGFLTGQKAMISVKAVAILSPIVDSPRTTLPYFRHFDSIVLVSQGDSSYFVALKSSSPRDNEVY